MVKEYLLSSDVWLRCEDDGGLGWSHQSAPLVHCTGLRIGEWGWGGLGEGVGGRRVPTKSFNCSPSLLSSSVTDGVMSSDVHSLLSIESQNREIESKIFTLNS